MLNRDQSELIMAKFDQSVSTIQKFMLECFASGKLESTDELKRVFKSFADTVERLTEKE